MHYVVAAVVGVVSGMYIWEPIISKHAMKQQEATPVNPSTGAITDDSTTRST